MATVPGTPDPPDLIPRELRPTQGDFYTAAAQLHQQGRFASLGDFRDLIKTPRADDPDFQDWQRQQQHEQLQPPQKPDEEPKDLSRVPMSKANGKVKVAQADLPGRPPLSPDVLGSQMAGHGVTPGPGTARGFKELEDIRFKTEQEQIKQSLPPPKTQAQKLREEIQGKSADEVLDNDRLWAIARDVHAQQEERMGFKVPFSRVFSGIAEGLLGRSLTAKELTKIMTGAARYGIGQ